jgi:NADPH-dependent 2,4-dienoyl-CoA reductase/sulfur reductase-like enzyme
LSNVYTLRNYIDNKDIYKAAKDAKNIVIIGGSFIGMEMASNIKQLNPKANITVIDRNNIPFEKILGKEIGMVLKQ